MKDYIEEKFGDVSLSYDRLRVAVQEAWEAITEERLSDLIDSMSERCQDVVNANGMHTKW